MAIRYPLTVVTNAQKQAWCQVGVELMRLEFLVMGKWFWEGVPLEEYQTLRAAVQIEWPYHEGKLPKSEWERYQTDRYDYKTGQLTSEILALRTAISQAKSYSVNLDDDIT